MEYQIQRTDNVIYGPNVEVNIERKGLGRTIFDLMKKHKDKIMQIDARNNEVQSYEYVNMKCVRIALEMRNRGINEKDVVMVCSGNNLDSAVIVYSALYLNAVAVNLDPALSFIDTIHLIRTASPKIIFVTEELINQLEQTLLQMEIDPEVIIIGKHETYSTLSDFTWPHSNEDIFKPDYVDDMHSTAMIFFTSGTTGTPRQVGTTHYGLLTACTAASIDTLNSETVLFYISFLCTAGFIVAMLALFVGGKRIVVDKFVPETFLKYVEEYRVTYAFLQATCVLAFNEDNIKKYKTESLVEMRISSCCLSSEQMSNLRRCFPDTNIYVVYGVKESVAWISTFSKFSDSLARVKLTSCGVPFLNTKVKIADIDTGRRLGPNEKGEIRVTSDHIANNLLHANTESRTDDEGFLKTGDVGMYDDDNCLYFLYRINDAFRYRDWYIVPDIVETVIAEHPAVKEAVVIGVPAELDDHHTMALVTLKDDHNDVTVKELLTFADGKLSDKHQLTAGLRIVNKFPKTYTGKVPRQIVRQMILAGSMKPFM